MCAADVDLSSAIGKADLRPFLPSEALSSATRRETWLSNKRGVCPSDILVT
jgi:hypothetical protein